MRISWLAAAAATLAFCGSAQATQYVQNGGFESSSYTNSLALFGPNTPATDWSSNGQWIMFCSGSGVRCDNPATYGYLAPPVPLSPQGSNFIGIDGTQGFNGSLSQTISGLQTGEQLTLSFYMATAQECCGGGPTTEQVVATLGGESFTTPTISTPNQGFTPWTLYSTTFTYDGTGDILTFINNGTGVPPYALIDGVSLVGAPGPGPATGAAVVLGVLALAYARRRLGEQA